MQATVLPEPEFANDADGLACADGDGDILDRADLSGRRAEATVRLATSSSAGAAACRGTLRLERRRHRRHSRVLSRGSSATRNPSPT